MGGKLPVQSACCSGVARLMEMLNDPVLWLFGWLMGTFSFRLFKKIHRDQTSPFTPRKV